MPLEMKKGISSQRSAFSRPGLELRIDEILMVKPKQIRELPGKVLLVLTDLAVNIDDAPAVLERLTNSNK